MAWVDTFLRLTGPPGQQGSTGSIGVAGGGLRTYATVYSDVDPTKGALYNVRANVSEGRGLSPLPSQSFVPSGVVVDYVGRYYFTSELDNAVYRVNRDRTTTTIMGGTLALAAATATPQISTLVQTAAPVGIAINSDRTVIYISCSGSNSIVKYDINSSLASNLDPTILTSGTLFSPKGICLGKVPNGSGSVVDALFIVNQGTHTVGQYTMGATPRYNIIAGLAWGAGSGVVYPGFTGDGGPATSASMLSPRDVCQVVGNSGQSVLLIADYGHYRVRQVTINGSVETSGTITTVVGNGIAFLDSDINDNPLGNAVAPFGIQYSQPTDTLYISSDRRLREIKNFKNGVASLSTIVGRVITPSTAAWSNIGSSGGEMSVSSLRGNIHIDHSGNIVTTGNQSNPILIYTTVKVTISAPLPAPRLGDIVNWVTRYNNGNGFQGVSMWVYNNYASDYLSGVSVGSQWIQIGSVLPDGLTSGGVGSNSSVTGYTGATGPTVRGPIGPTGPRALIAPDGPAGPTGAVGITDYFTYESMGPTGYEGAFGETGPTGAAGPSPDGPTGADGSTGSQGVRHANFYEDLPFPQAAVGFANPFPVTSLPGDYYIKQDTTALYHYGETIPPNSYYLNRILNTSASAINSANWAGDVINTASHARGIVYNNPGLTTTQLEEAVKTATTEFINAEKLFYKLQTKRAALNLDAKRKEISAARVLRNSGGSSMLNGSITPLTTPGSPFIYEFVQVPGSVMTTTNLYDNFYAAVCIDGTAIPGVFVYAGRRSPLFRATDSPAGITSRPLYIISMYDLSRNLPYVNYQIFWYTLNHPISPAIPPEAVIATYLGFTVNKRSSSTPELPTGYEVSLFFTNAGCGVDYPNLGKNDVQFDTPNIIPDGCEVSMMYGFDGVPVIGDAAFQFPWTMQNHFGGIIEVKITLTVSDIFSDSFMVPTRVGRYGLFNASETNEYIPPMCPNNYTSSLVTTLKFPDNIPNVLERDNNPVMSNTLSPGAIAVHPQTRDVYFTQAIRDIYGIKIGESLLQLKSSDIGPDGFTYSDISLLFSRAADVTVRIPDGTPVADVGCFFISGMVFDNIGNLYYSDHALHCVRKINLFEGNPIVTTVAGIYPPLGQSSEGSTVSGTSVELSNPRGLSVRNGYLYIADTGNNRVVRVDVAFRGLPPLIIGGGQGPTPGNRPGLMELPNAQLYDLLINKPYDVEVDSNENIYISDFENHCIWRANPADGRFVLFVGSWSYAGKSIPQDEPPSAGPPWWTWLIVAIVVVIAVVAIVLTCGVAAPGVAGSVGSASSWSLISGVSSFSASSSSLATASTTSLLSASTGSSFFSLSSASLVSTVSTASTMSTLSTVSTLSAASSLSTLSAGGVALGIAPVLGTTVGVTAAAASSGVAAGYLAALGGAGVVGWKILASGAIVGTVGGITAVGLSG